MIWFGPESASNHSNHTKLRQTMRHSFTLFPAQVDTTDAGYQIGYQIGTWLPFVVLAGLFILMLVSAQRRSQKND